MMGSLVLLGLILQIGAVQAKAPPGLPALNDLLRPGERMVTLEPPLRLDGKQYRLHYFATGDYASPATLLLTGGTGEMLTSRGITGLLLTADDQIVRDENEIRRVLLRYRAATILYEQATTQPLGFTDFYPFDELRSDLRLVTRNPLFVLQIIPGAFETQEERRLEALRAILAVQLSPPAEIEQAGNVVLEFLENGQASTVEQAVDLALESGRLSNSKEVRTAVAELKTWFKPFQRYTQQGRSYFEYNGKRIEFFNALTLVELALRMIWLNPYQTDRVALLENYQLAFAGDDVALPEPVARAAAVATAEADDASLQRAVILLDWIKESGTDLGTRLAAEEVGRRWVQWSWQEFGKRTVGHRVAGAASGVLLSLTLADLLYGFDDTYSKFVVAESSDELRLAFLDGRQQLQAEARRDNEWYDGQLAGQFQAAYLLESAAAAHMLRSFGDGIQASVDRGVLSLVTPISWWNFLTGDEYRSSAIGLIDIANGIEQEADALLGHPIIIDSFVDLIMNRLDLPGADDDCAINNPDGIQLYETATSHVACIDLTDPHLRFELVMANDSTSVNPTPDQRETVASIVARAPHADHRPLLAFNADYFGAGHGPEGFTVHNGQRLDGPANGDHDGEETARSSQAFGRANSVTLGRRSDGEVNDPLALATRFYNASGGGPLLVHNGAVVRDPCGAEGFAADVCRRTAQTGVGLSADGRTYIVIAAENVTAEELGERLLAYGAVEAIKLDGGGSTQLWYDGTTKIGGDRAVANAIVVFRERIPRHAAALLTQSRFPVVAPGAPLEMEFTLRNTGFLTWDATAGYALKNVDGNRLGLQAVQAVAGPIATNQDVTWVLPASAPATPGRYTTRWQMVYSGEGGEELFGPPVEYTLYVLPGLGPDGAPDLQSALRILLANLQAEIQRQVAQVVAELQRRAEEIAADLLARWLAELRAAILRELPPELQCLAPLTLFPLTLLAVAGVPALRRRRRP